mmetsp:Transcript_70771/g.166893  ORF Transcript_70771/g.166893 Transcript_70771/m.166893 type:complete len:216 (-) Transcript_70771:728-1375(-)
MLPHGSGAGETRHSCTCTSHRAFAVCTSDSACAVCVLYNPQIILVMLCVVELLRPTDVCCVGNLHVGVAVFEQPASLGAPRTFWAQHRVHTRTVTLVASGTARDDVDHRCWVGVVVSRDRLVEGGPQPLVGVLVSLDDDIHTSDVKELLQTGPDLAPRWPVGTVIVVDVGAVHRAMAKRDDPWSSGTVLVCSGEVALEPLKLGIRRPFALREECL